MKLTVERMIHMKHSIAKQLGGHYRGDAISYAEDMADLDRAVKDFATRCSFYDPNITVAPRAELNGVYMLDDTTVFSKRVLRPDVFGYKGSPLSGLCGQSVIKLGEFERSHPSWRNTASSTPKVAVIYGSNRVMLYPKPNEAALDTGGFFVSGTIIPGIILNDGSYHAKGFEVIEDEEISLPGGSTATASPTEVLFADDSTESISTELDSDDGTYFEVDSTLTILDVNLIKDQGDGGPPSFVNDDLEYTFTDFDWSVPEGAIIGDVELSSFVVNASFPTTDFEYIRCVFTFKTADGTHETVAEQIINNGGSDVTITMPSGLSGLSQTDLDDIVLHVKIYLVNDGGSPITIPLNFTLTMQFDQIVASVDYSEVTGVAASVASSSFATPSDLILQGVLDVREDLHEPIAIYAGILSSKAGISTKEAMNKLAMLMPDIERKFSEIEHDNMSSLVDLSRGIPMFNNLYY